jgi:uncharacterized phage-associated protein
MTFTLNKIIFLNVPKLCRHLRYFVTNYFTVRKNKSNSELMQHNYSKDQIAKIGNTIRFLTNEAALTKTKVLKILYLLEEESICKHGIPFFNIPFHVWKFGPVPKPVFQSFSILFDEYAMISFEEKANGEKIQLVTKVGEFSDDEFSDNDIDLMKQVKSRYKSKPSDELVEITHREGSPWYIAASENNLLEKFENDSLTASDVQINIETVIESPILIERYRDYIDCHGSPNA